MKSPFQLFLFVNDPDIVKIATRAGVHGFILDLETRGKENRQNGYDTQISTNSVEDLTLVRENTDNPVICRINPFGVWSQQEIETVISAGVDEIFLPMVRSPGEVVQVLECINDRCKLAILIETLDAVNQAELFTQFPLSRVYIGLNDLAIDRNINNIFLSVSDGTVEKVRKFFNNPFGFGGATLPEFGKPIPSRLLIGEMARIGCQFTFLRRSFYRDMVGGDYSVEIPRILDAFKNAYNRSTAEIESDRIKFMDAVNRWAMDSVEPNR